MLWGQASSLFFFFKFLQPAQEWQDGGIRNLDRRFISTYAHLTMDDISSYDHREPELPIARLRERIIGQLTLNYAHDNIDVDEFERRLARAHESDNRDSLKSLIRDLPVLRDDSAAESAGSDSPVAWNRGKVKKDDTMIAVMGGVERGGAWTPARYTKIFAMMGGVDLDFTDAKFPPGTSELDIFCLMGGVEMIVPEGVNVEMSGIPIMGGFEDKVGHSGYEGGPTLRIRGVALMGGVEVKPPKRKKGRGRTRLR